MPAEHSLRVLVTGASGFLGRHLVAELTARGHDVTGMDVRQPEVTVPGERPVVGDVRDLDRLLEVVRDRAIDSIVHAAAMAGARGSLTDPLGAVDVNVRGTLTAMQAARETRRRRFVDISSDEVYGDATPEPVGEEHPKRPGNPYAIAKLTSEMLGGYLADRGHIDYVAARLCWVYGPGYPRERIPRTFLLDALAGRRTCLASGADHELDLTYVSDAVVGLRLVLEAPSLRHRAYNLSGGRAVAVGEVAAMVQALVPGWTYEIGPGPLELGPGVAQAAKGPLDITRARDELGYRPRAELRAGLAAELAALTTGRDRVGSSAG